MKKAKFWLHEDIILRKQENNNPIKTVCLLGLNNNSPIDDPERCRIRFMQAASNLLYNGETYNDAPYHPYENRFEKIVNLLETAKREALFFHCLEAGLDIEQQEKMMKIVAQSQKRIFFTSDSPFLLNQMDDESAKKACFFIANGMVVSFFSIPSLSEKLCFMGAGEVYADTDLVRLPEEMLACGGREFLQNKQDRRLLRGLLAF